MEKLCTNLALGFHAAAQPLTILRASLDGSQSDRKTISELRVLVARSAVEVKRLCTLFNFMQELVFAESEEPELSATPILPLLESVADGVKLLFQKDEMFLSVIIPDTCDPVLIDREKTLEAVTGVLLIAHKMSRAKETVELIASVPSSELVQVVVRNVKSHSRAMNAEARLGIALAEANIRSQKAKFSLNLEPYSVQIELRKAPLTN